MLGQPGFELFVAAQLGLQGRQRVAARRQLGLQCQFLVQSLLCGAAQRVEPGQTVLQLQQVRVLVLGFFLRERRLAVRRQQLRRVGRRQRMALGLQAFAALPELSAVLVDAALLGRQHLNLLLPLRHARALLAGVGLALAPAVFQRRQGLRLLLNLRHQLLCMCLRVGQRLGQPLEFAAGVLGARRPGLQLFFELRQLQLDPLAALLHEANVRLDLAHPGVGFVQLALRLVDPVAGLVMRLANGFQIGLGAAQLGAACPDVLVRLGGAELESCLFGLRLGMSEKPELPLLECDAGVQLMVVRSPLGLSFQLVQVGFEFAHNVLHPGQVFARFFQPLRGFAAALLVLRDPGGFFQEQAQVLRPGLDDAADGALADDGVGARAQTGAQKHVLHVTATHRLVVDVVAAAAVAREHALDRDLGELAPRAACTLVGVVKHQLDTGAAGGFAAVAAVEDHVLHRLAAQLGCLGLAQHPAHRVHDVGLAAAIGADHAHQLPRQHEAGRVGKGLEAGQLDRTQTHKDPPEVADNTLQPPEKSKRSDGGNSSRRSK